MDILWQKYIRHLKLLIFLLGFIQNITMITYANEGIITTVVGNGTHHFSGESVLALDVGLFEPTQVRSDQSNNLFIVDSWSHRIFKVDNMGILSVIAGTGVGGFSGDNGVAVNAQLHYPYDVILDASENIYISDSWNNRVRRIDANGIITTIVGSGGYNGLNNDFAGDGNLANQALLSRPQGVAMDAYGNLYISDFYHNRIRKVDAAGVITTIAGNGIEGFNGEGGIALNLQLNQVKGLTIDYQGNLYIADSQNHRIRKLDITQGILTTIAGSGQTGKGQGGFSGDGGLATQAQLNQPTGVAVDKNNNIYIADYGNHRIRKVDSLGIITTIAGNGNLGFSGDNGEANQAQLYNPSSVSFDHMGNLYIADTGNNRIRKVMFSAIDNQPPQAHYSVVPNTGVAPLAVSLDASNSIDSDGSIIDYKWLIGEKILTGKTISVTLEQEGNYAITLAVTDDKGATHTTTNTVNVTSATQIGTNCNLVTEISMLECHSLLELYSSTNGINWLNKTGWNVTNTPCSWYGVTCANGGITEIKLDSNQLTGAIPNFTGLPHLQRLTFYGNQLTGNIPDFSGLPSLKILDLWNNQLTGSIPNFSKLPNLEWLYLNHNQLTGTIPDFSSLPNLDYFAAVFNQLTGSLPSFSKVFKLKSLILSDNQLTGPIPDFNHLSLKNLSLEHNSLCRNENVDYSTWQTQLDIFALCPPTDQPESGFCSTGNVNLNNIDTNCSNNNCNSSGVKILCNDENCQWCNINDKCSPILFNGITQISGGNINCDNGLCTYKTVNGGSSSSGFFVCQQAVINQPPIADFQISTPTGQAPLTVTLDASSSYDTDGKIVDYQWKSCFSSTISPCFVQTFSGKTITLTLENVMTYEIQLIVTDDKNATNTITKTITVTEKSNEPPIADFQISPSIGQVPLAITLDGSSSTDIDSNIVSYEWLASTFENCPVSPCMPILKEIHTSVDKSITFLLKEGQFAEVTLTVTDDKGAIHTKEGTVSASNYMKGIYLLVGTWVNKDGNTASIPRVLLSTDGEMIDFSFYTNCDEPLPCYWEEKSAYYMGNPTIIPYNASFTTTYTISIDESGSILHLHTDATVDSSSENDFYFYKESSIPNQLPVADFVSLPDQGVAPLPVVLDASTSHDPDGTIINYQWLVGGQEFSGQFVSLTLEHATYYPIILTVTDNHMAVSKKAGYVTVTAPVTADPKIRVEPTLLTFDNTENLRIRSKNQEVVLHKIPINQSLFIPAEAEEYSTDPTITRFSTVTINSNALSQADVSLGTVYAEQVILNLFNEISYNVINTSILYRAQDDYTWIGKIEGISIGDVILVVKNGKVTGNINAQGAIYRIRPTQADLHVIQEMDANGFPDENITVSTTQVTSLQNMTQSEQRKSPRTTREGDTIHLIDVMVVYTPLATQTTTRNDIDILSEIQLAVDETNQIYQNSGIQQKLRLVHTEQVNYQEIGNGDLDNVTNMKHEFLKQVHQWRDDYRADLVSLWVDDGASKPYCGVGRFMSTPSKQFEKYGFTVVERYCATAPVYAFAHELGHNMGAHHNKGATFNGKITDCSQSKTEPYNCGYIHDTGQTAGSWRTIMAYDTCRERGYSCTRIPYFSNPNVQYQGIATGDNAANNALALNNSAAIVTSFRESTDLLNKMSKILTIYNEGEAELVISNIIAENNVQRGITVTPNNVTIAPHESTSITVTVDFTQIPYGAAYNRLLITSNDKGNPIYPIEFTTNRKTDSGVNMATDTYDAALNELSVTATTQEGRTYQATLNPITLLPEVVGSVFQLEGTIELFGDFVDDESTYYDATTGMAQIPIASSYLSSGEPVLFRLEMQQGVNLDEFNVTDFTMIPVPITE